MPTNRSISESPRLEIRYTALMRSPERNARVSAGGAGFYWMEMLTGFRRRQKISPHRSDTLAGLFVNLSGV